MATPPGAPSGPCCFCSSKNSSAVISIRLGTPDAKSRDASDQTTKAVSQSYFKNCCQTCTSERLRCCVITAAVAVSVSAVLAVGFGFMARYGLIK